MLGQERRVHRIRMVEILPGSLFERQLGEILVVVVLFEDDDVPFGDGFDDPARDRRLARPGAAAYADDERPTVEWSNCLPPLLSALSASFFFDYGLGGGQTRDGHAKRRRADVVH